MAKLNLPLPSKGLVVDRPAEYVDSRAAVNIKNMEFNRSVIRKRIGTETLGSSLGERIQRYFELQDGLVTRLFRVGLTAVEVLDKAISVWSSVATAPLTGDETDSVSFAFPTLLGEKIVCYTNGVDPIRKCSMTGMDADLGGSPPLARHMRAFGDYLVLANVIDGGNTRSSRVQWPDTGNPESWTPGGDSNAGSIDLLDDADEITGMGIFGNFLTIHKAHAIYLGQLVTTASVFRFDRKPTGVGALNDAVIQNIPSGEQIFLAVDGIHLFNGVTAPLISSPVNDEIREELNPEALYKSQSVFVPELDEYWVCVALGSATEPNTVYKYNWRTQQVYKDDRADLTAFGLYLNTTGDDSWDGDSGTWDSDTTRWDSTVNRGLNSRVIIGDSAGVSSTRSANTANDAGVAIEAVWDTKDFTAQDYKIVDIDRIMRWKGMEIWAQGGSISVSYSVDGGNAWTLAQTVALTSDYPEDAAPIVVYFDVVSSRIRFRFSNILSDSSFTLKKYQLEAVQRETRK